MKQMQEQINSAINSFGKEGASSMPEFVGTTVLDTIGLVIPGVDERLREKMKIDPRWRSVGLISSRTGAAGQITAVDDAIKETNTEALSIMLPRDAKSWSGHGNYIVIGGETVADARRAVEISLRLIEKNAGELYASEAGHLEFAYSASADQALGKAFGIPKGQAFGLASGSPAAIGLVMADQAVKAADVDIVRYMTAEEGTSHTNEVIVVLAGETSAVKTSILTARETGLKLLGAMEGEIHCLGTPYIKE